MTQMHAYPKIAKLKLFIFLIIWVQLIAPSFVTAKAPKPNENIKLTQYNQLDCRFVLADLAVTLAYTVDSYLLFGEQYDVLRSKIERITQNGQKIPPETYVNFGSLESQFMLVFQLENNILSGLSSTETAWVFSNTATALKTSLDFMSANYNFDDPSIGQWEISQTGSVHGWFRGPDWSIMTITNGQILADEIKLEVLATLPEPVDEQSSSEDAAMLMDELWFGDSPDSELKETIKYQMEISYQSKLVDQMILTEESAVGAQQILQKAERTKQMLADGEIEQPFSLSSEGQTSVVYSLIGDLNQVLAETESYKHQLVVFRSITEEQLDETQIEKGEYPPLSDFSAQPVAGENDIILNWQPDLNGQGYQILVDGGIVDYLDFADQTEYIHYDCPVDTEITYQVRAIGDLLVSTNTISVRVQADTTEPEMPASMTEEIPFTDDLSAIKISHRKITWQPSPSGDVVSYRIIKGETVIATLPADTGQYIDDTGNFLQEYAVYAVDDVGNWSSGARNSSRDFRRMFGQLDEYSKEGALGKLVVLAERIKSTMMFSSIGKYVTDLMMQSFSEHNALPKLIALYTSALENDSSIYQESIKDYQLILASAYLANGQPQFATGIYRKLLEQSGKDEKLDLTASLASAYRQSGNSQQVVSLLEEVIELAPDRYDFYLDLAHTYHKLDLPSKVTNIVNQLQRRLDDLDKFKSKDRREFKSDGEGVFSVLGQLYELVGDYSNAIDIYKRGIYESSNRYLLSSLADAYESAGEIDTANQIRQSEDAEGMTRATEGSWGSERRRNRRQESNDHRISPITMIDTNGNEILLSDYTDRILILHFFAPNSNQANLQILSEFSQNRKGSLQVIGITGDHLKKSRHDLLPVNFPLVQFNRAEWDLFEFGISSQIKSFPTTLTIIGDGLFLVERYYDRLSNEVLQRLFNIAKEQRSKMHREPNILWAQKVLKFSSQYDEIDWSAEQLLGEPDTYPAHGDRPTAWAPATDRLRSTEFVQVSFAEPIQMEGLKVYETCNPGAISQVIATDQDGNQHNLWQKDTREITIVKKRIFRFNVPTTHYKVSAVEIRLQPSIDTSLYQIDAIGLLYPQD